MKTNARIVSLALAVLVATTLAPIRAGATITNYSFQGLEAVGTGCSLDARIGKTSLDTKHVVNLADCLDLRKNACYLKVKWMLNNETTSEWQWYAKLSLPNGTCAQTATNTVDDASCHTGMFYPAQDFPSTASATTVSLQVQVVSDVAADNALTTTDCQSGTDKTTNLYVIVSAPAVLTTAAWVDGEAIPFRFDLKPPAAPVLGEPNEGDSNITVKWTDPDNTDETGLTYAVYTSKETFDGTTLTLAKRDGSISSHTHQVTGLDNNVMYYYAVAAVDENGNEGPLSAVSTAMPVPVYDFFEAYRSPPEVGHDKGGYCFIATAAYGSYMADEVWTLRAFRDRFLMTWGPGRGLVATYYALSPPLADFIAGSEGLRATARVMLWPLVTMAGLATALPSGWGFVVPLCLILVMFAAGFATLAVVRARRRS